MHRWMKGMDIRVSHVFTEINQLGMFYFAFKEVKEGEDLLFVFAHQGWWNYGAEITFRNVFLPLGPGELSWNIRCRLATKEEASHLRSQHSFSEEATAYCFQDTSRYFGGRGVPDDVAVPPDLFQPQKSFVVAHSVKIVAFKTDSSLPIDWNNRWRKGDFYDLSEGRQQSLLRGPSTKKVAKKAAREAKRARTHHPYEETGEEA